MLLWYAQKINSKSVIIGLIDVMNINRYTRWYVLVITVALLKTCNLCGLSLVYSMKIRRAFDSSALSSSHQKKTIALVSALPIFYVRERNIVVPFLEQDIYEKTKMFGAIFNVRTITPNYWWVELTTGVENESIASSGTNISKISGVGMDDILIAAGKNFFVGGKAQFAAYGLAGFPIEQDVSIPETQTTLVGSRFYGLGAGAEFSYAFIKKIERSFVGIVQARFVHLFTRSWYPILSFGDRIQPGNFTDLFLIAQCREKMNVFEVGYNPTFFTNQAVLLQAGSLQSPNFVRNSFYANYTYIFKELPLVEIPGALGAGLSISRSSLLTTKIEAGWINITVLF